jgi:hypothetical protein
VLLSILRICWLLKPAEAQEMHARVQLAGVRTFDRSPFKTLPRGLHHHTYVARHISMAPLNDDPSSGKESAEGTTAARFALMAGALQDLPILTILQEGP